MALLAGGGWRPFDAPDAVDAAYTCIARYVMCEEGATLTTQEADLNLLLALDALLTEGSVVGAAKRLRLSASATSHALARLRRATGDPLLVRAGRGLVPTPRAVELRGRAGRVIEEARQLLRPAGNLDLAGLETMFTLRISDGFVETFGPGLMARLARDAPGVRLRFLTKLDRESMGLRDGSIDLETGIVSAATSPELRTQALFKDRFIGVVRRGHALSKATITPERYAAERHIIGPRGHTDRGPVDDALALLGLERRIATVVNGFGNALALVRGSDLVAAVPERHTATLRSELFSFQLPFDVPRATISLLWHPRRDADPAHRWLRACVKDVCEDAPGMRGPAGGFGS